MLKKTLLIELATEELPAKHLKNIAKSFYNATVDELYYYNIKYETISWFATPRRLSIKINSLNMLRTIKKSIIIGPPTSISFDKNGKFTQVAHLWIKRLSIPSTEIKIIKNKHGERLTYQQHSKTQNIKSLLADIIITIIKQIKCPKTMKWNDTQFKFSRPIRNIITLLNDNIIPIKFLNIQSNRLTSAHLFMKNILINIKHADQYPDVLLNEGQVIADYEKRKRKIQKLICKVAKKIKGYVKNNQQLLEEITSLVEWPTVFLGKFNKKFLLLPRESIEYTIEIVQKCFVIYNTKKNILPYFIIVSNINCENPKSIVKGNELVVYSRLSDAEFFYNIDRHKPLESYLIQLKKIIFYKNLGSMYEKIQRLKILMKWTFMFTTINKKDAIRAVHLSKCDLATNMVLEFPNIQGCIGMHYALSDKEKTEVALAIKEHYCPKFSGDMLPTNTIAYSLAIIDKLDTIVGMFLVGEHPKKNNDPFGLRRLAIGILKILIEKKININLKFFIQYNITLYKNVINQSILNNIITFFLHRIYHIYSKKNIKINIIQSITSLQLTTPLDIHKRITAILKFIYSKNINIIINTNKRILNFITRNQETKTYLKIHQTLIQKSLFKNKFEIILFNEYYKIKKELKNYIIHQKYNTILFKIIKLCKIVNYFFLYVTINKCNNIVYYNRFLLLMHIKDLFLIIANFSYL